MLGTFRYLLALLVTLSHLWTDLAGWSGVAAVFGFFVISGYLMTSILHHTYGFTSRGIGRYAMNRFLRLFPPYWVVLLLATAVVAAIPRDAFMTNFKLSMPQHAGDWLPNVFIVGLLDGPVKVLIPPAWTLDIELLFYALMAAGLARSRWTITTWFLASFAYTGFQLLLGADFVQRYAAYAAASLPFAAGAMAYAWRGALRRWLPVPAPVAWLLLGLALVAARMHWLGDPLGTGFYTVVCCCLLLLVALNHIDPAGVSPWMRNLDRQLGNLAYPVFLCHWQVAAVVLHIAYAGVRPMGGALWLWSFIFTNLVAALVYWLVDRNINRLRDRVRGKERLRLADLTR